MFLYSPKIYYVDNLKKLENINFSLTSIPKKKFQLQILYEIKFIIFKKSNFNTKKKDD